MPHHPVWGCLSCWAFDKLKTQCGGQLQAEPGGRLYRRAILKREESMSDENSRTAPSRLRGGVSRRALIASGVGALASPAVLRVIPANAQSKTIKVGHVSPKTGPLAGFGEADGFIIEQVNKILKPGLQSGGKTYTVEIISKDSQSTGTRASEVASELILHDKVDLILASSAPDTTNPVADQAEVNEVPCITTNCPWQPYFFGRNGNPAKGFTWTYHFFWGLEDLISVFANMWTDISTNKVVGALWPNDAEGVAYSDAKFGFPGTLEARGFKLVDPGRFELSSRDFSEQIRKFKEEKVEILTGVMPPPAFAAFWKQAGEAQFAPRVATVAKALLFPAAVEALGDRGADLTTEIWWSPSFPYKSGLTGQNAAELSAAYEDETKKQWTQPIGFHHALFEVALDVLKRTKDVDSPDSIRDAIRATKYDSIVGHIAWEGRPVPNVTKTTLVGGQWIPGYKFDKWLAGQKFKYDLVIVNNAEDDLIGVQRKLEPLGTA
jgi:branched-chain amino acid transport system substrate-binding protein